MANVETPRKYKFVFEISGVSAELSVVEFEAKEAISSLFEVNLSLASEGEVKFDEVINKEALLTIQGEEKERYFHGIINHFVETGSKGRFYLYDAKVVPLFWLLSLEKDCRIFQNKNVQEIVQDIFQDAKITSKNFEFRLQNKDQYQPREYCVQYRETDLNFISRLFEEEGIFYFFEHAKEKHVMVIGDSPVNYKNIEGNKELEWHPTDSMVPGEEFVYQFIVSRQICSGKVTQKDFNFEKPSLDLKTEEKAGTFQQLEIYDYPGRYRDNDRGQKLTKVRLQEAELFINKAEGEGNSPRFTPGFKFQLSKQERINAGPDLEYLLVSILHRGEQPQVLEEMIDTKKGLKYFNRFISLPSDPKNPVYFRPQRITPKPIVEGIQTAIVVGPKNEEIYTEKYGRVKVQFHWDREGAKDDKSSCWIRVASIFAGGQYGGIFTPRIGQEVIVDFLEGDPDQPLITGRVYNADLMPPYTLPDEKTKSTIKTNSSIGGDGFNEIRFEDEKGKEQIFIHGEKDIDIRIKSDRRETIGNDRNLVVKRDQLDKIERDKHVKIERDEFRETSNDYNLKIGGKEAAEVGGSLSLTVGGDVIEVFKGGHNEQVTQSYYVKAMNVVIEGMTQLTVKVGGNFIDINPAGIFIQGTMVMINSGGAPGMGVPLVAVPPSPPLVAADAADASPGKDTSSQAPSHKKPTEEDKEKKKSWIEIELVDEDNNPVPGERYKITLPDGKTLAEGTLDEKGFARVDGIDPGTCKITFPRLDKDAWEKA